MIIKVFIKYICELSLLAMCSYEHELHSTCNIFRHLGKEVTTEVIYLYYKAIIYECSHGDPSFFLEKNEMIRLRTLHEKLCLHGLLHSNRELT